MRWQTVRGVIAATFAGTMMTGAGLAWWMRYRNPYRPVLERIELPLPKGHPGLAGLTLGFVTDTHVNPYFGPEDLQRGLDLILTARPDVLLLGGDYISEATRYIDQAAPLLGAAARAVPLGALAVLGNHDLGGHGPAVVAALEAERIRVLRNDAVPIPFGGDELWVVGTDDSLLGQPLPSVGFARVPDGAATLSLWHEPDTADQAARLGAFAQLSGHSHGGQVRIAGLGELVVPVGGKKYPIGQYVIDGMPLYVSRGLGTYRPPVHFRCPPEVTLVTLVAPE